MKRLYHSSPARSVPLQSALGRLALSLIFVTGSPSTSQAIVPPDVAVERLDVSGYFVLVSAPTPTFSSIAWLELWQDTKGSHSAVTIRGALRFKPEPGRTVGSTVPLRQVTLSGLLLRFRSGQYRGAIYSFSGQFLRSGVFHDSASPDEPVLRGSLSRTVAGRSTSATEVAFRFTAGD